MYVTRSRKFVLKVREALGDTGVCQANLRSLDFILCAMKGTFSVEVTLYFRKINLYEIGIQDALGREKFRIR